jgi:hypothetical protein
MDLFGAPFIPHQNDPPNAVGEGIRAFIHPDSDSDFEPSLDEESSNEASE